MNYIVLLCAVLIYGVYLLQRRGPQRSVDTIVSATFIATLILICFLSVELLKVINCLIV